MKIDRTKKTFSKKVLIIILVLAILVGGSVYAFRGNLFPKNTPSKSKTPSNSSVNYSPATTNQKAAGSSIKSQSATDGANTNPNPSPTGQNKSTVTVSIPSANQVGSYYHITSQINTVTANGTCTLTLSKAGQTTVTATASVQAQATVSTCEGFSVPLSQLSTGTWQVNLIFSSDTLTGSTTTSIVVS